jgi:hypothetical protein
LQSIIFSAKETTWQKLANLGLEIIDSLWFDSYHMIFRSDLVSNRFGLAFCFS